MELLDIVDENNNLTGEVFEREYVHNNGLRHRESAVMIINEKNQLLLEKRADTKKHSPNKWALCAGHVSSGENPEDTMIRELKEEVGLETDKKDLIFLDICKVTDDPKKAYKNNTFLYIYFLKTNKKIEDYVIQQEELSEVRYFSIQEIEEAISIRNTDFAFHSKEYIKIALSKVKEICNI